MKPIKITEYGNLHFEIYDTDTDFQIVANYLKKGFFTKRKTQYKCYIYDTINKKPIQTYYCQNADELREKVKNLLTDIKLINMSNGKVIMKFILFLMNFDRDFLKKAFAAAAKVQHLGEMYFWDKYQVEIKYTHKCPELAIMCVLTEMADKLQEAFFNYVYTNYKCGRYDE